MKRSTINRANFVGVSAALSCVAGLAATKVPPEWVFVVAGLAPSAGAMLVVTCIARNWFGMGISSKEPDVEVTMADGTTHRMTTTECIDRLYSHNRDMMGQVEMLRAATKALSIAAYQQGYEEGAEDGERGAVQPERRAREFAEETMPPATKVH